MAFDEALTLRMRTALADRADTSEQWLMGDTCLFFVAGKLACGADRSKLGGRRFMFRVGEANVAAATLARETPMVPGGRPRSGFHFVDGDRCDDDLLQRWLELALAHAGTLTPK